MRLADFIMRDMETILVKWEAFAATQLPAAQTMGRLALRDHARQILDAVARDIPLAQSREAQKLKSEGQAPRAADAPETAAETHALLRARSGFDMNQLAAEYRALRSSVLRLWGDACGPSGTDVGDMVRFNEAIDQALCESIAFFGMEVDETRNLFLGMLGHDMRNPISAIIMTAALLARLDAGPEVKSAAGRLSNSGSRLKALLDDLTDFNRTKLGLGMNIVCAPIDLADVFTREVQQMRAVHPGRRIELGVEGDMHGKWDGHRLSQMLGNLVSNAVRYGSADAPVEVLLVAETTGVRLEVRNQGEAIDADTLRLMFDPLRRGTANPDLPGSDNNLGLGLYITREIALAHGGTIGATSDAAATIFRVRLPRDATPHQPTT